MKHYESAVCRCSKCGKRFRVLADEVGDHSCPRCGFTPYAETEQDEEDECLN